jgi:hypothetical protein
MHDFGDSLTQSTSELPPSFTVQHHRQRPAERDEPGAASVFCDCAAEKSPEGVKQSPSPWPPRDPSAFADAL